MIRSRPFAATLTAGVAVLLASAGCQSVVEPAGPLEALPRSLSAAEQDVIASSNAFAFELMRVVNDGQEGENVFISPLSVSMALGMTMNGARGTTFDEMRDALGHGGLDQAAINGAYAGVLDLLSGLDRSVRIDVGNSVWYRAGFAFDDNFFATVRTGFRAHVEGIDFDAPSALTRINGWVRDATRGRIDGIVDQIPPDAVMYLINAIYFKGDWSQKFDRAATRPASFTRLDGGSAEVQMMFNIGRYGYAGTADFEMIDVPYGNEAFSMTILLPREGRDVNGVLDGLSRAGWSQAVAGLAKDRMALEMPRFRMEYERGLNDPLKALGIERAFAPGGADFTGMSTVRGNDLYISEVKHKSFVEVNEEGTEAAAATSVEVSIVSMPPTFRVDRPFLFVIRERFSGTILFLGKIVAPTEAAG